MGNAKRDDNYITTLIAVSNADGITPVTLYADPTTHRLLVSTTAGSLNDLSDVVITSAAQGDILYFNGTNWVNLAAGTTGKFLKTQGAGANPMWDTPSAGAAGSDTQVQFNDGGSALGGDAGFTYNKTTDAVSANGGFLPITNDTGALGSATKSFADLFLASGALINFANGDVVLTHSAGVLTLTTGTLALGANNLTMTGSIGATGARVTKVWATDLEVTNAIAGSITGTAAVATTVTAANEATDTTCFIAFVTAATGNLGVKTNAGLTFNSSTGVITLASSVLTTTDINGGTIDGVTIGGASAGAITGTTITVTTALAVSANDGAAIGASGTAFSDLFLASGAVINFAAGNATITHSSGLLTLNVPLSVGTSNAVTLGSIQLGHATDTTITRVSAGVVAIEGVNVVTVSATQTLSNKSVSGALTLEENASIALDPAGSADGKYSGITVTGTAGYAQTYGDLVYLDPTDSRWEKCDANAASGADGDARGVIGIVVVAGAADGNACTILLHGIIRADAAFPAFTINNPIYVSETAGAVTQTQPTTTDVVIRIVGSALTADEMYFNPDRIWFTHT